MPPFRLPQFGDEQLTIKTNPDGSVRMTSLNGVPYGTLSVHLPGVQLRAGEFIFKTYSENRGLYESLLGLGIVEPTGTTVDVGRAGPQPVCRLKEPVPTIGDVIPEVIDEVRKRKEQWAAVSKLREIFD